MFSRLAKDFQGFFFFKIATDILSLFLRKKVSVSENLKMVLLRGEKHFFFRIMASHVGHYKKSRNVIHVMYVVRYVLIYYPFLG
jgi:hypothetical protein